MCICVFLHSSWTSTHFASGTILSIKFVEFISGIVAVKAVRPGRGKKSPQATLPPSDHSTQRSSTGSSGCGSLVV